MTWLVIPDYEHSAYSAASADSTSASSRGAGLSVTVKSTHTPSGFSRNRWQQVISMLRQSGMTLQLSENPNLPKLDRSTAWLEDSLAPIFPVPARVRESKGSEVDCSSRLSGSFAWLDRDSSSWKTSQRSLLEDWIPYCESWPKAGTMQDGVCYRRPRWERPISGIVGGSWPTPAAANAVQGQNESDGKRGQTLVGAARGQMWPTPNVPKRGPESRASKQNRGSGGIDLQTAVKFMMPSARDYKGPSGPNAQALKRGQNANLCDQIGGQLNPTWVEWLMGYPTEWTALDAWEMQ